MRVLHLQPESVQQIHSPHGLVLVEGVKKPSNSTPFDMKPDFKRVDLDAWTFGSNIESTHTSASQHWDQKVMHVMAQTAASNVLVRSKWCFNVWR